jgi:hypothetical protein
MRPHDRLGRVQPHLPADRHPQLRHPQCAADHQRRDREHDPEDMAAQLLPQLEHGYGDGHPHPRA